LRYRQQRLEALEDVQAVRCPTCDAGPSQKCELTTGQAGQTVVLGILAAAIFGTVLSLSYRVLNSILG
jgi:hypothetical protein